jgi:RNA recognition motif-containing protein
MGTKLYVSNLPLSATEATLTSRFCKFGAVVSVVLDAVQRANRRGAVVEMQTSADALKAISGLNLSDIDGRLVSVYLALGSVQPNQSVQ